MYALLCILDDASLIQIHQRLHSNSMEFAFLRDTIITHSIEKGRLQAWVDCTTKEPYSFFYLILHKNTSLIGDLRENILHFQHKFLKFLGFSKGKIHFFPKELKKWSSCQTNGYHFLGGGGQSPKQ